MAKPDGYVVSTGKCTLDSRDSDEEIKIPHLIIVYGLHVERIILGIY